MQSSDDSNLEKYEFPIVAFALGFYVIERFLAFIFLQNWSVESGAMESQILGFLFGQPPYSILNILLGFDLNQGLFGFVQPRNLILAAIQIAHFGLNYWILKLPMIAFVRWRTHKTD
jgi:hypothetical protein